MSHAPKTLPLKDPLTIQLPAANVTASVAPLLLRFPLLCPKKARLLLDELEGNVQMAIGIVEQEMKVMESHHSTSSHNVNFQSSSSGNNPFSSHSHSNQQNPLQLQQVKKCFLRLYRKYLGKTDEAEQLKAKVEQLERQNSMLKLRNRQLIQSTLKQTNQYDQDRRVL